MSQKAIELLREGLKASHRLEETLAFMDLKEAVKQALAELEKQPDLEAEYEQLKKQLRLKRNGHDADCPQYKYGKNYKCNCSQLLSQKKAEVEETK